MRYAILLCIVFFISSCKPDLTDDFSFLEGNWKMETSDSTYLLESWEKVDEQTYKALNYTVSDVGMQLSEQIAIEITDSGTYYKPMIEGLSEGIEFSFKFVSQDDNKYIFENKTYDFPSKIWYKLVDSNTIQAGIENQGGDKRESFIYEKVENE